MCIRERERELKAIGLLSSIMVLGLGSDQQGGIVVARASTASNTIILSSRSQRGNSKRQHLTEEVMMIILVFAVGCCVLGRESLDTSPPR